MRTDEEIARSLAEEEPKKVQFQRFESQDVVAESGRRPSGAAS